MDELMRELNKTIESLLAQRDEAATALRASAERERELREALAIAEKGLETMIRQYASVAITGSRVAQDEQYPWVATAMKAQAAARSILNKQGDS